MTVVRLTDSLRKVVTTTLHELCTEDKDVMWDLNMQWDEEIESHPHIYLWISIDQPDDLRVEIWAKQQLPYATEENVEAMVRESWERLTIEEMELRLLQ